VPTQRLTEVGRDESDPPLELDEHREPAIANLERFRGLAESSTS
jgi:hypothetical protein